MDFFNLKNFKHYSSEIKKLFDFDYKLKKKNLKKLMTSKKKKVAVHIRRYNMKHHILPPLPWKYYENAINKFDPNEYDFILFTDNYVEVINNMDTSKFLYFDESSELDDLFLMSQCDAFIMSNSTLSKMGSLAGKREKNNHTSNLVWNCWTNRFKRFDS